MKRIAIKLEATVLLAAILIASSACAKHNESADATANTNAPATNANSNQGVTSNLVAARFTDDELDESFARIALYPDPILAQMIPAATYVDQLKQASGTLRGSDDDLISKQNWDASVKSVAHYPQVLQMMVAAEDWTTSAGRKPSEGFLKEASGLFVAFVAKFEPYMDARRIPVIEQFGDIRYMGAWQWKGF